MSLNKTPIDVIVIGGGHAGIEAALAAARLGCQTLLITLSLETIGVMPCNPAIGGLGKGHLVRELDALGGEMAKAIDATRIQFRLLNASKGSAVRSSRAQADRHRYQRLMRSVLGSTRGLEIFQSEVTEILTEGEQVRGVRTNIGLEIACKSVVIATGTFLNGKIHIGLHHYAGGRSAEPAATGLSASLQALGLKLGRLKTGTVPRLDKRTIDYSKVPIQEGVDPYGRFSFTPVENDLEQVSCHVTYTNERTHDIIRKNLHRSPLYCGEIKGVGPRYCPSIEDKVVRFADRDRHQIFLEPESLETLEVYPSGISTSLPFDVQCDLVHSIRGLEQAHIIRPGYAVEYDFVFPTQLLPSLETLAVRGLFLAGQINGTSGYEEAAGQGIIAGINAARAARELSSVTLSRSEAYIGVMIDDLVTKGTEEPYRMFTSRAEYRLLLREDNADRRLRPLGQRVGLVSQADAIAFETKCAQLEQGLHRVRSMRLSPSLELSPYLQQVGLAAPTQPLTFAELLKRPGASIEVLLPLEPSLAELPVEVLDQIELEVKYEGYIRRQEEEIARDRRLEATHIPSTMDYAPIAGLSTEIREKLTKVRPQTVAQAARIPGVTPAAVAMIMVSLKKMGAL